ncbi:M20/M25/M40 family metallo-hydrolase [Shewanella sp. OMA3-2]|uniref:M20/M25/M40 family metallo-hydrolase n=1 Tax=Shewanella sp. OMA3-2 TaxID=2908650 RepID=UPI001F2DDB50|nr:M20/M25/M40 family metallo-hydrolase [Shewanella sp. OMA3-2]UJF22596.1 M28 family peptidase [Shewanella sp. OMA3-2]
MTSTLKSAFPLKGYSRLLPKNIKVLAQAKSLTKLSCIALIMLTGCVNTASIDCNLPPQHQWADKTQIIEDIRTLTATEFSGRKTGTQGSVLSQNYLAQRFTDIGLIPWQQSFKVTFKYQHQFSQQLGVNMIGIIPSSTPSNRWRVITAHYDHLGQQGKRIFHGADDNASGVAGLLAIAQQWQLTGLKDINLMLVATDAEEQGLYGSYGLVEQIKATAEMQVELAMNLDMIGHPSRPRAIYIEGEQNFSHFKKTQAWLSQQHQVCIRLSYSKLNTNGIKRMNWLKASDHYPFHRAGIAWIYFGVPPHSKYHTVDDTIDTLNIDFLTSVTEMAFSFITQTNIQLKEK